MLDEGIVITPTPRGFGMEISVLVKNAIGFGRVAIVGMKNFLFKNMNTKVLVI